MFTIYGNKESFYQWDSNQKLIVNGTPCSEIHFSNALYSNAFICIPYEQDGLLLVDVPNILLQDALDIRVYTVIEDGGTCETCNKAVFEVIHRDKPADYVYTETEVKRYDDLENRISELEENSGGVSDEQIANAVEDCLAAKIFYADYPYTTHEEVSNAIAEGKEVRIKSAYGIAYYSRTNEFDTHIFSYFPYSDFPRSKQFQLELVYCYKLPNGFTQWTHSSVYVPSQEGIDEALTIAKGANKALSYTNYQSLITSINLLDYEALNIGQNIYIETLNVPDLWISKCTGPYEAKEEYTYTTDEAFVNELMTNGSVKVGCYYLSALETQKVDLSEYVKKDDVYSKEELDTILGSYVDDMAELLGGGA